VVCSLCLQDDETIEHLLIHCEVTKNIWKGIFKELNFLEEWRNSTTKKKPSPMVFKISRIEIHPFSG
jgi:hypothetical protein